MDWAIAGQFLAAGIVVGWFLRWAWLDRRHPRIQIACRVDGCDFNARTDGPNCVDHALEILENHQGNIHGIPGRKA